MEAKTCPILTAMTGSGALTACLREICAWWDSTNERCVVKSIAAELYNIRNSMTTRLSPGAQDYVL